MRHKKRLVVTLLAAIASLTIGTNAFAGIAPMIHEPEGTQTLCSPDAWEYVDQGAEILYNDVIVPSDSQCIADTDNGTHFVITKSTTPDYAWNAFPELYIGCWHGICSKTGPLPEQVSSINHLVEHLRTRYRRSTQVGNDADDFWFSQTDAKQKHPDGMELMIWPTWSNEPLIHARKVDIGGRHWWIESWIDKRFGTSWLYRQLRPVHPNRNALANLNLIPIFHYLERHGLNPDWYAMSFGAGYEIVHNGTGDETYTYGLSF